MAISITNTIHPLIQPHLALVRELCESGQDFHRRGWSLGTSSNFSVVVGRDPLTLLMTGSGFDKGRLEPGHFTVVGADAASLDPALPRPSAEALLHTALARAGGAGAVLHTHSVEATILSEAWLARSELVIEGYEMLKGLAGITTHETRVVLPIFANTQDIASLAQVVETRLAGSMNPIKHGFLMAGHGLYTWGDSIAAARRHIEVLEFLFQVVTRKQLLFSQV
jgi:methylthioribulose-1-phosphate dehydratase